MIGASSVLDRDLRRALGFVAPYWRRLAVVLVLSLASTAVSLALPYLSKSLVDRALLGRDWGVLVRIVLVFLGLTVAGFLINVESGLRFTRVSAEMLFAMRRALFEHLQRLSPRFYARMPLGQIASRINSDVDEIQRAVGSFALAWVSSAVSLVGTVAIVLVLDPVLFVLSLALLPAALWVLVRYRRRFQDSIKIVREQSAEVGSFLTESLQAMKLVVGLNAQERQVARFQERTDTYIASLMAMRKLTYLSGGLPGLLLAGGGAVVFLVGGWRVIHGAITTGTFVAFMAYQMRIFGPIQGMMGLYTSLATTRVSLKRVFEILDTPPEVVDAADAVAMPSVRGDVAFDDVTFAFEPGTPVLERVRLRVRAGERVAIVGSSGIGKSTVADLLVRHFDPLGGRITLDGVDVKRIRLGDLRRHVVVVDQEPFIFNATIAENIRYARPEASEGEVLDAARAAGLGEFLTRSPTGLATPAGERGRALSMGERQRVSIARAFLANPAVVVLDEATGSLDPATEAEVVSGYEAVMRGRTTIVITHRFELARRAERVVVIEAGRVVEEGTAEELLARGGAFASLFAPGQPAR